MNINRVVLTGNLTAGRGPAYAALLLTPVSLVLGKLVGLYNRDATVIDKSTQELPRGRRCVEPSGSRSEWKARTDFMGMW
jgi:hypothetical protein